MLVKEKVIKSDKSSKKYEANFRWLQCFNWGLL